MHRRLLFAIALALCLTAGGAVADATPDKAFGTAKVGGGWRVLVLTLVDPELPASIVHGRSIRDALEAQAPGQLTFYSETFDAPNFDAPKMEPEMFALLKKKYANQPIDLVVGVSADVSDFIDKYHDVLWPGAAIMFTAVHSRQSRGIQAIQRYPYVAWQVDVPGTLKLVQDLQPDARRLVVIGGTTYLDDIILEDARSALVDNTRWKVEFWTSYTQAQLRERLALLPKDTAVLYTTLFKDAAGAAAYPRNALEFIAEQSSVPVYGMFSSYIGHRMAAGSLLDIEQMGKKAADLGVALLKHRPLTPQEMHVLSQPRCFADAKRVDSFGMSIKSLPGDCDIQNPVRNLWTDYRGLVLAVLAVMVFQAATIGGLFWQKRRRQAAELESDINRLELRRAMRFTAMGELTASIAHEINQPLGAIMSNAEAAEMLLDNGSASLGELKAILADIRRDDHRAHTVVSRLRSLLSKADVQQVPVHLHQNIQETLTVLMPEARRRGVSVQLDLRAANDLVLGDPIQFQQVLLNLVINAMDALDHTERTLRRIQIQTTSAHDHMALVVADNGCGMDDATQATMFDSLFTTKRAGLGMGLSIVRAILDSHNGSVQVQSSPGAGSVFTVSLPLFKDTL